MRFVIIQHDPLAQPTKEAGRLGVLTPVNMDGFYAREADAEGVAQFMAEQRPDLETMIVQVVRKVGP